MEDAQDGPSCRPIFERHPCTWRSATCKPPPGALVGEALPAAQPEDLGIAPRRHLRRSLRVPNPVPGQNSTLHTNAPAVASVMPAPADFDYRAAKPIQKR
jgi:hypothetical protein